MRPLIPALLLCLLWPLSGQASTVPRHVTDSNAPRALDSDGPVQVQWQDPAKFSEITHSGNRWEAARGNWVYELAEHLARQATPRLGPGQRLEVSIQDIDLAGDYEPWRGPRWQDTRYVRDIYPPRIDISYRLLDAQGQVLDSQQQTLRDLGFLHGSGSMVRYRNDSLRHEKRLIDRWLQQALPATSGQLAHGRK